MALTEALAYDLGPIEVAADRLIVICKP